jgi:hypothetical protein
MGAVLIVPGGSRQVGLYILSIQTCLAKSTAWIRRRLLGACDALFYLRGIQLG